MITLSVAIMFQGMFRKRGRPPEQLPIGGYENSDQQGVGQIPVHQSLVPLEEPKQLPLPSVREFEHDVVMQHEIDAGNNPFAQLRLQQQSDNQQVSQDRRLAYNPLHQRTLWADVGNAMYGYVGTKLELVEDWKKQHYKDETRGDVIEAAFNLYYMYSVLIIDVASLLGVTEEQLTGWWAQVKMLQRDAYIQSCSVLEGDFSSKHFEHACMYMAMLPTMTVQELISVTSKTISQKGLCSKSPLCNALFSQAPQLFLALRAVQILRHMAAWGPRARPSRSAGPKFRRASCCFLTLPPSDSKARPVKLTVCSACKLCLDQTHTGKRRSSGRLQSNFPPVEGCLRTWTLDVSRIIKGKNKPKRTAKLTKDNFDKSNKAPAQCVSGSLVKAMAKTPSNDITCDGKQVSDAMFSN